MLFNSIEFAFFFPIVTILFFFLPHKYRWFLLLAASCFFYMFFKPVYILILAFTIIIDYFAGILISNEENRRRRKLFLVMSIVANVGVLVVFKYYNFLAENINVMVREMNVGRPLPLLAILLPIGLSFHTFQAMSYTIEIYRGNQKPERHFGIYALYVMFYPQLVAGPIERPQNIIHQFHEKKYFNYENGRAGMIMIAWGLFKKVVIADRLGLFVAYIYSNPQKHQGIPLIISTVFFAFQVFCDFSGYSDIALGTARVMGYDLMINFKAPFTSRSITEFWRRWHISLSSWFNDYVFTPIITSLRHWGKAAVALGLFFTFFLSGIWHGAGWTFIIYGIMHGLGVIYEFYTKKTRKSIFKKLPSWVNDYMSTVLTFMFVSFSWIFFRAASIGDAFYIVSHLGTDLVGQARDIVVNKNLMRLDLLYLGQSSPEFYLSLGLISIVILVQRITKEQSFDQWLISRPKPVRWSVYYSLVMFFVLLGIFNRSQFIYFQF